LIGRAAQLAALDDSVADARRGTGGVLVVRGEPGSGKTVLLEYAVEAAAGMRLLSATGLEAESSLIFAGLHRLLGPLLEGVDRLPRPQRDALRSALGLKARRRADPFLVGLAVLGLLADVAREEPVLCVVDDAHWLDEASLAAFAFVARRIDADQIGFLFAVRESTKAIALLAGLPEVQATPLLDADARAFLASVDKGRMHPTVADRIVQEARGNPLALRELHAALTKEQLAGTAALPEPLSLGGGLLEEIFMRQVRVLPEDSQLLMLVAAAAAAEDVGVLWRATTVLGIAPGAAAVAEGRQLVSLRSGVAFRHPLIRSAVYSAADSVQRRRVHQAIADAIEPEADPDRRAWHRAAATVGTDEEVAVELELSADRARRRGGYAAVATLLGRSTELTADPQLRASRRIAAAEADLAAGAPRKAAARLAEAEAEPLDALQAAETERLAGNVSIALGDLGRSSLLLTQAAQALERVDARRAREAHLEALEAALYAGAFAGEGGIEQVARAAMRAPRLEDSRTTAGDDLLDGLSRLFTEGHALAAAPLRSAIDKCEHSRNLRWVGLGAHAAGLLWDDESFHSLSKRRVQLARATGALTALPNALALLGGYEILVGRLDFAAACFDESDAIAAATGNPGIMGRGRSPDLNLAAWRGRETETRELAIACLSDGTVRGSTLLVGFAYNALCVLELGLGNYPAALAAAEEGSQNVWIRQRLLPDLVEAAARSGDAPTAAAATRRLAEATLPTSTAWGLGVLAQSRALTSTKDEADANYREAIDQLKRCRVAPQLARCRLLYGEWLRRERRRREAREQLRAALGTFDLMGAAAFGKRARTELLSTGARGPRADDTSTEMLTPHELRVAQLAATGASNREIATQLFVSPRTVEYHLRKVFQKLGLSSRVELAPYVADRADPRPAPRVS
jgi:DNA-binding CsgD family transcriptional regulator/tetratricopeptide (TPR) repeat protein